MLTITNYTDNRMHSILIEPSDVFIENFVHRDQILNVQFMIDCSGSMGERLKSSYLNKLNIVKTSLCKIFEYFTTIGDKGTIINCCFSIFNENLEHLFSNKIVNSSTIETIIEHIDKIIAKGRTDMSKALEYCNGWLLQKLNTMSTTNIVIFVTDGYHSNQDEKQELISNFVATNMSKYYYSIGLGVSGEYDQELLAKLFTKFYGCPTAESTIDTIVQSAFSGTSTILSDVKFVFSGVDNVQTFLKLENDNYVIDKIDLSTLIPFSFSISEKLLPKPTLTIIGKDNTYENVKLVFNLDEKLINNVTQHSIFQKLFEFEKLFLEITEHSNSHANCKLRLEAVKILIEVFISENNEHITKLKPFYQNLKIKIENFDANLDSVYIKQLNDEEFGNWLKLGSIAIRHASSNGVVPQLGRRCSETISQSHNVNNPNFQKPPDRRQSLHPLNLHRLNSMSNPVSNIANYEHILCKICYSNPIQVMNIPCKHVTSCMDCVRNIDNCPLCRASIESGKKLEVLDKCIKCKINSPNILFLPCSHVIVCEQCLNNKTTHLCNICTTTFSTYCKLYN